VRRPSILNVALVCGVGAFCWTLFRGVPERGSHESFVEEQTRMAAGALAQAKTPLERLEAEILMPDVGRDPGRWMRLAQRREWSGRDNAKEAWEHAFKQSYESNDDARMVGRRHYIHGIAALKIGFEAEGMDSLRAARAWYEERLKESAMGHRAYYTLGVICKHLGDTEAEKAAWQTAEEMVSPYAETDADSALDLARFRCLQGRHEEAMKALRHAANLGYSDAELVEHDEDFAPLREDQDLPFILLRMRENALKPVPRGAPSRF
jgi:tetratricopeptide (TPR) repeat protein